MSSKGKILVVDDDATTQTLLQSRLSEQGYAVQVAGDGLQALEQCRADRFDIIILDIIMPQMDGYTFLQEFKRMGDIQRTPIIILTSLDTMKEIFEIEGINDYVVKPFKMEDLLRKIEKRMQAKHKKVLIVDDEVAMSDMLEKRLIANGYEVITASDGLAGLEKARRDKPDLVVLDIMLPKLDGYSVCRMLKFDEKYKNMSVVLLSALAMDKDSQTSKDVRADAYLTKPFDSFVLLNTIKQLLWD